MASGMKDFDKDLEFIFDDSDTYENEISELYSYTEEAEIASNLQNFEELLKSKGHQNWCDLSIEEKRSLVLHIVQVFELANKVERFKAIGWLLYLVQGVFGESKDTKEQAENCRSNCLLLYKLGIFSITKELLMMEISSSNSESSAAKKTTLLSIADSKELRSLIIILYTMVETLRREESTDSTENQQIRKEFLHDLEQGLNDSEPLVIILFNMVSKFSSENSSPLPMKKVLLLLWKLLLTILGGYQSIHDNKRKKRVEAGLPILKEDPLQVIREMKASVPPTSAADILDMAQVSGKRRGRKSMLYGFDGENSETDVDGNRNAKGDTVPFEEEKVTSIDDDPSTAVDKVISESLIDSNEVADGLLDKTNGIIAFSSEDSKTEVSDVAEPGAMTPMLPRSGPTLTKDTASIAAKLLKIRREQQEAERDADIPTVKVISGLPWIPKAREKDVEAFLNLVRQKFIGFPLHGDLTTEAGLPTPTMDSVKILRKHKYTSLSELQIAKETEISKYPLTIGKNEVVSETLTERLYQVMLPNLPQYMIALLKILLAAAPTSKSKNDSVIILSDVLPEEMPSTPVASVKLGIDVNRHREIIVKSISGIILLLLKHFKLSHIYQFEYASQHLVFANCIPLVLKFFNQNIVAYVTTKNTIGGLEFPACVIGEKQELTAESLEGVDNNSGPCWRNLFSSISLLRILNKLVKWKHSRTMMLVVFKSAPILKRALKVRQAMFQLYVLKLLKAQTKYLGRQWRKSNMKTMSAIYQKVRHRLNDDWAYGNDVDARPWDFQQEECALRACVERFNARRYRMTGSRVGGTPNIASPVDEDYSPVDNNLQNLLREEVELPYDFRKSYDVWLEREVYFSETDWDQLLAISCVQ